MSEMFLMKTLGGASWA